MKSMWSTREKRETREMWPHVQYVPVPTTQSARRRFQMPRFDQRQLAPVLASARPFWGAAVGPNAPVQKQVAHKSGLASLRRWAMQKARVSTTALFMLTGMISYVTTGSVLCVNPRIIDDTINPSSKPEDYGATCVAASRQAHFATVEMVIGTPPVSYRLLLRTDGGQYCDARRAPDITLLRPSALLSSSSNCVISPSDASRRICSDAAIVRERTAGKSFVNKMRPITFVHGESALLGPEAVQLRLDGELRLCRKRWYVLADDELCIIDKSGIQKYRPQCTAHSGTSSNTIRAHAAYWWGAPIDPTLPTLQPPPPPKALYPPAPPWPPAAPGTVVEPPLAMPQPPFTPNPPAVPPAPPPPPPPFGTPVEPMPIAHTYFTTSLEALIRGGDWSDVPAAACVECGARCGASPTNHSYVQLLPMASALSSQWLGYSTKTVFDGEYDNRMVSTMRSAIEMGAQCAQWKSGQLAAAHIMFTTLCTDLYVQGVLSSSYHCMQTRMRSIPYTRISTHRIEFAIDEDGSACIRASYAATLADVPETDKDGVSSYRSWLGWVRLLLMLLAAAIMWVRRDDYTKQADSIFSQCLLIDSYCHSIRLCDTAKRAPAVEPPVEKSPSSDSLPNTAVEIDQSDKSSCATRPPEPKPALPSPELSAVNHPDGRRSPILALLAAGARVSMAYYILLPDASVQFIAHREIAAGLASLVHLLVLFVASTQFSLGCTAARVSSHSPDAHDDICKDRDHKKLPYDPRILGMSTSRIRCPFTPPCNLPGTNRLSFHEAGLRPTLGGSSAIVDASCAVLSAYSTAPIQGNESGFDAVARVLTMVFIAFACIGRCFLSSACAGVLVRRSWTLEGSFSTTAWIRAASFIIGTASAAFWVFQLVVLATTTTRVVVLPFAVDLMRARTGEFGRYALTVFLGFTLLSGPRIVANAVRIASNELSKEHVG